MQSRLSVQLEKTTSPRRSHREGSTGAENVGGVAGGELGGQEGLSAAGDAAVSAYLAFSQTKQVMLRIQR